MRYTEMIPGLDYTVTKSSSNGMIQKGDVRTYPVFGHIEYALLTEESDTAYITLGLIPTGTTVIQKINLPPLERNLADKIHDMFNIYAEEVNLTILEETWESGTVCEFTISYIIEYQLVQKVTVAYKSRYSKLSEMAKPTICIWNSKDNKVEVYDFEEGLDIALKSVNNLSIQNCMDDSYRLSLDAAISHAEEVAERLANRHLNNGEDCKLCAIEHQQLADWLKELREFRHKYGKEGEQ